MLARVVLILFGLDFVVSMQQQQPELQRKQRNHHYSVEELLTTTFPKKLSNDSGLNPCKAEVFLDDIAMTFDDAARKYQAQDDGKQQLQSESAFKILEKNKIWKTTHSIHKRAVATTIKSRLWDSGIIYYEIDETYSGARKGLAKQAMRHWENHTCLKFLERNKDDTDVDYVYFTEKTCGCCSFVGRRGVGAQALSIGDNCAVFGIVVHEIGHAIGYYHEHTRPDRDKYVQVFEDNIMEDQRNNFKILPTDQVSSLGFKYDYGSIMHYARTTYSKNAYVNTIQPIGMQEGEVPEIGQRIGLSPGDIQQTLILYNCPKCGRTFQTKFGSFSSPTTSEQSIADCEWRISATAGEKIVLNITSMDISQSPFCLGDYLEIRDGYSVDSEVLGKFCGSGNFTNIITKTNRMLVKYRSKNTKEYKGFKANFEVVCGGLIHIESIGYLESPNYPEEYLSEQLCVWQISVPQTYQVAVKFLSFDLEHHVECVYDYLEISENTTRLQKLCGSVLPDHMVATTNQITVKFISDKSKQRGGFSLKIYAEYNECETTQDHGCHHLCLNTLGSYMCACQLGYELHSDRRTCIDACGGKFKALNGTVTSPSFPELYPLRKHCVWEIEAPSQHVIFFNFTHFDIEGNYDDPDCNYDHVNLTSVLSTGKSKLHGTYCGSKTPKMIASDSNLLQISFASDDSVQQSGFAAVYFMDFDECATRNGGCDHDCTNTLNSFQCSCRTGFSLADNQKTCIEGDCVHDIFTTSLPEDFGSISSPNYPKYYPPSKDCAWHFKTVPGHRIRLTFLNFNLESHPECYFDNVQIFDGDSAKSHEKGRYCGGSVPFPIDSTDNQLYMTFKSDNNVNKKGFWATYFTLCGGIHQASIEKRQIYSHTLYGNGTYPDMRACDWYLIGNDGYNVKMTFKNFDLEHEEDCSFDYVEVVDGLDGINGRKFGKYCGNQTLFEVTSTEEGAVVKFRTDDRIAGGGFLLEYQLVENIYSVEEYENPID